MFDALIAPIALAIIQFINATGYSGVFILMMLESALIPIPSEITMVFAGSQIPNGEFNLLMLSLVGALANLVGSLIAYGLGYWGEETFIRDLIKTKGKYLLLTVKEFDHSLHWFNKYGNIIVFVSRLLPGIRTFISLPAGIAHMNLKKFCIYTFLGSFIWSFILSYIGMVMGENWETIHSYFKKFDVLIVVSCMMIVAAYIFHKVRVIRSQS
jgi:membrane protein DedA with SNARE-associated domain